MQLNSFSEKGTLSSNQRLKSHFLHFYQLAVNAHIVTDCAFENFNGIKVAYTGIPYPFCNAIIVDEITSVHKHRTLYEAISFLKEKNISFAVYLDPQYQVLDPILEKTNINPIDTFLGFYADNIQLPNDHKLHEIKCVNSQEELITFNNIVSHCFAFNEKAKKTHLEFLAYTLTFKDNSIKHYLSFSNGKPVSTLSFFRHDNFVSIWNGATLPEYRSQGYCSSLAYKGLKVAKQEGCQGWMTYLMNDMALSIVDSLGGKKEKDIVTYAIQV